MSYSFEAEIKDEHLDIITQYIECEVEVDATVIGGELITEVTDVLREGKSLTRGDELSRALAARIMNMAEDDLRNGGPLWSRVREAEGIVLTGHPADPDTQWKQVA